VPFAGALLDHLGWEALGLALALAAGGAGAILLGARRAR